MQVLRSYKDPFRNWIHPETYQAGVEFYLTMIRLAKMCEFEGRRSDATWVLDSTNGRLPHLFSGPQAVDSFRSQARDFQVSELADHIYKPTQAEIARGVQVDENGYAVTVPAIMQAWRKSNEFRTRYT